jgi:hypothetical protein
LTGAIAAAVSLGTPVRARAQHVAVGVGVGVGYPVPAYGFYGYYPWAPYYQVGPYPYPYPYPFHYVDPGASLRLDVKPKNAEVYVDGYYAGVVDDFSGTFKHLNVPAGEHELTLYLEGYRTAKQQLRLTSDKTLKVKYVMEKLAEGETQEPRPSPPPPPPDQGQYQGGPPSTAYPPNEPGVRVGTPRPMPPNAPPPPNVPRTPNAPPPPGSSRQASGYGTIAIRVQPGDAEVMIDGEPWHGPSDQDRLLVEVPVGRHAIEIRKAGYRTYVTELDVHAGETEPLNVSLRGQ